MLNWYSYNDSGDKKRLTNQPTIINVSNRLPVKLGKTIMSSSGGLVSAFEDIRQSGKLLWYGWPGKAVEKNRQSEIRDVLVKEHQCFPIFLSKQQISGYYNGFSNTNLWPLLHYFLSYTRYRSEWFEQYREVNQLFCETIAESAPQGSLVWVHDYHLMLLPEMLRQARPDLKIGFFLHTPFPSYEVFRTHPHRKALLKGILGAHLIGFHTYSYLRHFRSSILRICGVDSDVDYIHNEHDSRLGVFPIGISWDYFNDLLESPDFDVQYEAFKTLYQGKRLILGVDRVDYTKGLLFKLNAFEQYLDHHPEARDNTMLLQLAIPSREVQESSKQLLSKIEHAVSRINGKYSSLANIPVHYLHKSVKPMELAALYALAKVALVTPVIDGMNLVAKEYIACQVKEPGTLILSEFAGAAQELHQATIVNPYDIEAIAGVIHDALEVPADEAKKRLANMQYLVRKNNSQFWAHNFIQKLQSTMLIEPQITNVNGLPSDILNRLISGNKIALFLDYDGTLREFETEPHLAVPHPETITLISDLNQHPNVDVCVISGRSKLELQEWFGHLPVHLIAEHGFHFRLLGESWMTPFQYVDLDWKEDVYKLFLHYSLSTPGSFVELKETSLVWHYKKTDPEFGKWKASQLYGELYDLSSNLPQEVRHGHHIIEA